MNILDTISTDLLLSIFLLSFYYVTLINIYKIHIFLPYLKWGGQPMKSIQDKNIYRAL